MKLKERSHWRENIFPVKLAIKTRVQTNLPFLPHLGNSYNIILVESCPSIISMPALSPQDMILYSVDIISAKQLLQNTLMRRESGRFAAFSIPELYKQCVVDCLLHLWANISSAFQEKELPWRQLVPTLPTICQSCQISFIYKEILGIKL